MTFTAMFLSKHSRTSGRALAALALAAATSLAAAPARAQAMGPVDARPLSLDEALHLAYRNNRDLRQARARVDQAHAGVQQAWAALLPNVGAQGKYTHNYKQVTLDLTQQLQPNVDLANLIKLGVTDPAAQTAIDQYIDGVNAAIAQGKRHPIVIQPQEQLDLALNATVPLAVPWAYPALQAAKSNEGASAASQAVTTASVLFSTAQAYYACAGSDELVEARRHAVVVAQKALDNARARLEAGVVNRVEVTRAELQLVRQQQALLEARDNQAAAYRALGTILAVHEPVRVLPEPEPAPRPETVQERTQMALKLRPEFDLYKLSIKGNRETALSNALRWLPTVSAFGTLRAFNYAGFSGDRYLWAVGLQADWTLYDGGVRDAQRHLATAQRRENEAKLDLLRDQVADDISNAQRQLATKRSALDAAKRSVQLSKETLELVQVQHDAGTATQLDLLQAQDNLVAAEVALAQARFDLSLGALQLERLTGTFPANLKL